MKTAAITGGIGDAVYSLRVLHRLDVKTLYVKDDKYDPPYGGKVQALHDFFETQGIKVLPTDPNYPMMVFDPELHYDYNIDQFRLMNNRATVHIIKNMMFRFRCFDRNWNQPFIKNIPTSCTGYTVISLTDRWRENSRVDWKRVYKSISKPCIFIGFKSDHEKFCKLYGDIEYCLTTNLLESARVVAAADAVYCNQCVTLTLAQGLGKQYFYERKPQKENTSFFTPNEHIL